MAKLEPVTGIAPSSWASYLVNGDDSGIEPADKAAADKFAEFMGGNIVSCEDAGFCWTHDATRYGIGGADCQEYTALVSIDLSGDTVDIDACKAGGKHLSDCDADGYCNNCGQQPDDSTEFEV